MRGYWAVLCFSVTLIACGGGTTTDNASKADAAAQQHQSEVGTAALGTARLQ
jgi:hypothetical protein